MTNNKYHNDKSSYSDKQQQIIQVIAQIPAGKVLNYGEVAALAGLPGAARLVGNTLKNLPKDSTLQWHRVINSRGMISLANSSSGRVQKKRLVREGIKFKNDRVDLQTYLWRP